MRLPLEPLTDLIERRGGLHSVLLNAGHRERSTGYVRYATVVRRAAQTDSKLTYAAADRFCIEVFGLHPAEVFGEDWWFDIDGWVA